MNESISSRNLAVFEKAFLKDKAHLVAMNAVTRNNVMDAARNPYCDTVHLPGFTSSIPDAAGCSLP